MTTREHSRGTKVLVTHNPGPKGRETNTRRWLVFEVFANGAATLREWWGEQHHLEQASARECTTAWALGVEHALSTSQAWETLGDQLGETLGRAIAADGAAENVEEQIERTLEDARSSAGGTMAPEWLRIKGKPAHRPPRRPGGEDAHERTTAATPSANRSAGEKVVRLVLGAIGVIGAVTIVSGLNQAARWVGDTDTQPTQSAAESTWESDVPDPANPWRIDPSAAPETWRCKRAVGALRRAFADATGGARSSAATPVELARSEQVPGRSNDEVTFGWIAPGRGLVQIYGHGHSVWRADIQPIAPCADTER